MVSNIEAFHWTFLVAGFWRFFQKIVVLFNTTILRSVVAILQLFLGLAVLLFVGLPFIFKYTPAIQVSISCTTSSIMLLSIPSATLSSSPSSASQRI
jgi:hypothetical protein